MEDYQEFAGAQTAVSGRDAGRTVTFAGETP
jgi:hypothetical protein